MSQGSQKHAVINGPASLVLAAVAHHSMVTREGLVPPGPQIRESATLMWVTLVCLSWLVLG